MAPQDQCFDSTHRTRHAARGTTLKATALEAIFGISNHNEQEIPQYDK